MLRLIGMLGLSMLAMQGQAVAGGNLFDDLFGPYLDRRDTVTPGAGDAKDTNAAAHVIDPWPPRVGARSIPGDGKRSADAVRRYRQSLEPPAQNETATLPNTSAPGTTGGDASATASH
jgi:hypothetical protein